MPKHDFIPGREPKLNEWSRQFSSYLNAHAAALGVTAAQAAAYTALQDEFDTQFVLANTNSTRTPTVIEAKNLAKKALVAETRRLARIIQANPDVTNAQRSSLGLTIPDEHLTPVAPPRSCPSVTILNTLSRRVMLRLWNTAERSRRGRPRGVIGAMIFSAVGEKAPLDLDQWQFRMMTTRHRATVRIPSSIPPGAKVWLAARWINTRLEPGQFSAAVSTHVQSGVVHAHAA